MQIIIYSTSTCPYCGTLKDYLSQKHLGFVEKFIDTDEVARKEMEKESQGFLGVPFVNITKDDGTKENIIGFDKGKLESVLSHIA